MAIFLNPPLEAVPNFIALQLLETIQLEMAIFSQGRSL